MSTHADDQKDPGVRLTALREEGAELLARRPVPGSSDHARLAWIDAEIAEVTQRLPRGAASLQRTVGCLQAVPARNPQYSRREPSLKRVDAGRDARQCVFEKRQAPYNAPAGSLPPSGRCNRHIPMVAGAQVCRFASARWRIPSRRACAQQGCQQCQRGIQIVPTGGTQADAQAARTVTGSEHHAVGRCQLHAPCRCCRHQGLGSVA